MIYILPFIDAFLVWLLIRLAAKPLMKRFFDRQPLKHKLQEKLKSADLVAYAEPLVEKRLEAFLQNLKEQIPLASMLITSNLVTKMKEQGKGEILKMVPEVKRTLIEKLDEEGVLDLTPITDPLIEKGAWVGAALGFCLGVVHVIFMLFVCK